MVKNISCKGVHMKCSGIFLALFVMLFSSCAFNFENDSKDITVDESLHTTIEASDSVQVVKWWNKDDALQYYEVQFVLSGTETGSRKIDQIQHYSAAGDLKWSYVYSYNSDTLVEKVTYFSAADTTPSFFHVFVYDTEKRVIEQAEYDGAGLLQWVRTNSYKVTDAAVDPIENAASYNSEPKNDGTIKYSFFPDSITWNMEVTYGSNSNIVVGLTAPSPTAEAVTISPISAHEKIVLSAPATPGSVTLVPETLSVAAYRFAYTDPLGKSVVSLNPAWYPVSVIRSGDDRLGGNTVQVDLAYDGSNRIISKTTHYGSAMALKVILEYNASNFPIKITTTGAALLLPMEYTFEYDENNRPAKISITTAGTVLQYFEYMYPDATVSLIMDNVHSIDPFSFLESLLSANVIIKNFNGDKILQQTFTIQAVTAGLQINVTKPDEIFNGSYNVKYNTDGKAIGLSAKDKNDNEVWAMEFALPDAAFELYATGVDSSLKFGRIFETYVPADSSAALETEAAAAICNNFIYDLLF